MLKKIRFWILALAITLASAVYQRMTGPTYADSGRAEMGGVALAYDWPRSHGGPGDQEIAIEVADPAVEGWLVWRPYPTDDPWIETPLRREGGRLTGLLPHQPPAGKLEYSLRLARGAEILTLPAGGPVIIRFKGAVPLAVLVPHVLFMFSGMLLANRAGLAALTREASTRRLAVTTTIVLFLGGLLFGPLVQHYAFGAYWTGIPFGYDLTDNKTLIAFAVWAAALVAGRRGRPARGWVLLATLVTLVIFAIPHSLLGSELPRE